MGGSVTVDVQSYIDGVDPATRPLFDRVHGLILDEFPAAEVRISYSMPTYHVGEQSVHLAAWKHGVSLYGWNEGEDGGIVERFPELSSGRGTLKITHKAAREITDEELRTVIRGALTAAP
jgi:uncharacterized protein YdhG (YjbR/CyaY superfamily)